MMTPIDDAKRRRLFRLSAVLCATSLLLAPLAGRSSIELANERALFDGGLTAPAVPTASKENGVDVVRDPFTPDATPSPAAVVVSDAMPAVPIGTSIVGMHVTQGMPMGIALPPNRGASGALIPAVPVASSITVRAVVIGGSSYALIDDGAKSRIIGVGDVVAGSRIMEITAGGIRLQNGLFYPLAQDGE